VTELPFDLSIPRITRIAIGLGLVGVAGSFFLRGWREAAGFLVGSALSLITIRSWFKLAGNVGADGGMPGGGAAAFLVLRYVLIAAAIYATIKILGSSPVALLLGLLVSFVAVLIELFLGFTTPGLTKNKPSK